MSYVHSAIDAHSRLAFSEIHDDERGLTTKEFAPYYITAAPSATLLKPVDALSVETQSRYTYDGLGRTTHLREDSVTGNLRAAWTYDGAARGKLISATRYAGGQSYIQTITGYDDGYRPLSATYTVPGRVPALPATITATTDLVCHGLTYWEFRPLVQHNATIAWNLLQTLAKRLRAAQGEEPA